MAKEEKVKLYIFTNEEGYEFKSYGERHKEYHDKQRKKRRLNNELK